MPTLWGRWPVASVTTYLLPSARTPMDFPSFTASPSVLPPPKNLETHMKPPMRVSASSCSSHAHFSRVISAPKRNPNQLSHLSEEAWRERGANQTCVIRAWDLSKPLLFCPAMNTAMWKHPLTAQQVGQLKAFGYMEIPCVSKKLVCGDQGLGAMAEVETIVDKVKEVLFQHGGVQQS
ncbi:phosphopantothenoylcysteine decarboxylase isoform X3 [Peromyscus maniculatus bairdii]|uniref:phosphopantothenoylcysteine decarboxylase isoform X3 n=1 Tax=Peromyscus maniculatus bairdii TaxID=230844 RepID=UPI001C2E59B3|nr:phosphopantothenoylcysteine decarboxylase isoform X4 [Peromyscus maniculatus bairdii]XP_042136934.1 phosphopantothenoylcysteine decarboxylase isoform X4 [Peromyscus maniculatus bairdii]XP_042136935.1 phosphopantothenoylcysteine decarboxylase isoform X4 [Peromyscus maniculatus bairdii]XP_042136936.1 phosphopantothenoylcysteine decarboxylase isoform X4 [Peromyscus maniculatus bairdii]